MMVKGWDSISRILGTQMKQWFPGMERVGPRFRTMRVPPRGRGVRVAWVPEEYQRVRRPRIMRSKAHIDPAMLVICG